MVQGQAPGEGHTKTPAGPQPARVSEEAVREELTRVLSCHEFRSSKRSQEFLRYVVEHTLSGRTDMLKERTIGIEVFGRSTSYEPSDDATVRALVITGAGTAFSAGCILRTCAPRFGGRSWRQTQSRSG